MLVEVPKLKRNPNPVKWKWNTINNSYTLRKLLEINNEDVRFYNTKEHNIINIKKLIKTNVPDLGCS